jgi:nifR3 family TIM-barrel protein
MHFWETLQKPFLVVAPMADVTDAPFRRMLAKYSRHTRKDGTQGGPDVMWTEFVSADGLIRATEEGKKKLMADLLYSEEERPIVAQLFSSHPQYMEEASALCRELGFDGIDINMGCPDKSIERQGCGSAMIKTPEVARAVIEAAKRGAGNLPVSVKTRLGYNKDELEIWLPHLLSCEPAVVTLHARTRKELSKVPARWERVRDAVAIRDGLGVTTKIIGNGDVLSHTDALSKITYSGADGAMVGRALFGNPWFFHPQRSLPHTMTSLPTKGVDREKLVGAFMPQDGVEIVSLRERLSVLVEHSKLFVELLPHKNFSVMKKHYKAYVNGFVGASELRAQLMDTETVEEVEGIIENFLKSTR